MPEEPAPEAGCTASYPDRLDLVTDIPDEEQYHDDTIVCGNSDLSAATLENKSGVVFAFYSDDAEATADLDSSELAGGIFREEVAAQQLDVGTFAVPGDVMVLASPGLQGVASIEWHVDPILTSAWLVQETIVGRLQNLTQVAAVDMFASGSKARKAVATCAFAGGYTAKAVQDLTEGSDQFFGTFAVAAAASPCIAAWGAAERELGTTRWPTLSSSLQTAGFAAEEVTWLSGKVAWVSKWISVFKGVVH
ncbi:hypothetical protein ACLBXX_14775 [Microbacterium sp. C23T]